MNIMSWLAIISEIVGAVKMVTSIGSLNRNASIRLTGLAGGLIRLVKADMPS